MGGLATMNMMCIGSVIVIVSFVLSLNLAVNLLLPPEFEECRTVFSAILEMTNVSIKF